MSSPAPSPRRRPFPLRALGFVLFIFYFLRALVVANLQLARCILFERRNDLAPGFLTYPVEQLSKLEIFVLSHCITLTPGTTTVEVSRDFTRLTLHALDARDAEATLRGIRDELEAPILRWTR
ncbi:Na+/H+ antiporter subunit E [Sorangium sp. So ce1097]|uniref:Na+/H+ antiporter subunit E n=1 Tax=Sorangium sp. So ce1097 TaxID=3133330 RepID=UPI003F617AA0